MEEGERLYDTSALIELVKRGVKRISGFTTILNVIEYPPAAALGLNIVYPTRADYELAFIWQLELRRRGRSIPAVDLVIAAIAVNKGLKLIAVNEHFKWIADVDSRLKLELM